MEELSKVEYWFNKLPEDEKRGTYYEIEVSVAISDLTKRIGYPENEVASQIQFLEYHKEVKYVYDSPEVGWYMLTPNGRISYADDKYVKMAKEEQLGFWGKRVTIGATLGAFVISAIALILNWYSVNKTSTGIEVMNKKIEFIGTKVDSLTIKK